MTESVTDIIVERARRQEPMTRMVVMSLVGHATVFGLLILMSATAETAPPPKVFMVSLAGGTGPKTGGVNTIGGRAVERVAPPEPKAVEPPPPAAAPPKMTLPEPKAQPKPQPRTEKTPPKAETAIPAPPAAGDEIRAGSTKMDTGAKGVGFGLSSGGGGIRSSIATDVTDFCCPEYLVDVVDRIRRVWNQDAGRRGVAVVRFTIQRDGRVRDVGVFRSSGVGALDIAAERAVQLAALPGLPTQFREQALGVSLTFDYEQR